MEIRRGVIEFEARRSSSLVTFEAGSKNQTVGRSGRIVGDGRRQYIFFTYLTTQQGILVCTHGIIALVMIAVGVRSIRDTSGLITHWDRIMTTQQAIDSNAAGKAFSDKQTSKRLLGLEGNEVDVLD